MMLTKFSVVLVLCLLVLNVESAGTVRLKVHENKLIMQAKNRADVLFNFYYPFIFIFSTILFTKFIFFFLSPIFSVFHFIFSPFIHSFSFSLKNSI